MENMIEAIDPFVLSFAQQTVSGQKPVNSSARNIIQLKGNTKLRAKSSNQDLINITSATHPDIKNQHVNILADYYHNNQKPVTDSYDTQPLSNR